MGKNVAFTRHIRYSTTRHKPVGEYYDLKKKAESELKEEEKVVTVAFDKLGRPLYAINVDYDIQKFKGIGIGA
jgi:hypothetical protein